jgi:hypothetical protein
MRQVTKTKWECSTCGAIVALPRGQAPTVWIRETDDALSERLIIAGDVVVHRCSGRTRAAEQAPDPSS